MIEIARVWMIVCIGLAAICLGDIAAGRRQKMAIMNVVWPITMLYAGPIGFIAYHSFGRAPAHGEHSPGGQRPVRRPNLPT